MTNYAKREDSSVIPSISSTIVGRIVLFGFLVYLAYGIWIAVLLPVYTNRLLDEKGQLTTAVIISVVHNDITFDICVNGKYYKGKSSLPSRSTRQLEAPILEGERYYCYYVPNRVIHKTVLFPYPIMQITLLPLPSEMQNREKEKERIDSLYKRPIKRDKGGPR